MAGGVYPSMKLDEQETAALATLKESMDSLMATCNSKPAWQHHVLERIGAVLTDVRGLQRLIERRPHSGHGGPNGE